MLEWSKEIHSAYFSWEKRFAMNRNFDRIFWGWLLVLGGVLVLLSRYTGFEDLNLFWLVLSVFLVAALFKSLFVLDFTGILFPLAFLVIIYDDYLNLTAITPWPVLLAALLGSIGLNMIFPKSKIRQKFGQSQDWSQPDHASEIYLKASFNSSVKTISAPDFQGAQIECSFASLKIHFDQARIQTSPAVIEVDVSFGGVELYLPKAWHVIDKTVCTFGAVEQKNRSDSTYPEVVLEGRVSFGGIEIIYV